MAKPDQLSARVTMNRQGRLIIPAPLRRALGMQPGETLITRVEDDRLVLQRREALLDELQSWFASVPSDVSLVDELIAERRQEALRDLED